MGATAMWDFLLDIKIDDPAFLWTWYILSAAALIYLVFKKRTAAWFLTAFIVLVVGALIGVGVVWLAVNVLDAFGGPVNEVTWFWVPAAFAGILLAIFNLWGSRWWRKVIAIISILMFVATATFAISAAYGLSPTLGALLHVSTAKAIDIPTPGPTDTADPDEPLYQTWKAPSDMRKTGMTGLVQGGIPNTNSGFPARPAQIYTPPAANTKDAPLLPVVIMMMGQPGDPDPQYIAKVLDEYAAKNNGLAPIALVVDQLSDPSQDPLCLDTSRAKVETYIMKDVVPWAKANLRALHAAKYWTVAGYSNGGQCAASFGSKYPDTFGNILAVSPEEYPGADDPSGPLSWAFNGDQAAYDAAKPANIMAKNAPYADTTAVFTIGSNDLSPSYQEGTQRLADAAKSAGMATTFYSVPGADHGATGLNGGLEKGFEILYPRLGLSAG
ncbi:alpha/beta hydrolase-fold protein [Agromyces sp. PvR057]|uniref:alpha/beta hydrolase-fold protein n=1 Tax=Agromyces sp. PvR057 TaxID=3156403 RepID=UPI003390DA89